jgi:hypothetical protein
MEVLKMQAGTSPGPAPAVGETAPTGELVERLLGDVERLLRLEAELAKREGMALAVRNGQAAAMLGAGGALAATAGLVSVPVLLVAILPWHWQVAAIWFGVYAIGAAILIPTGRARLQVRPPARTLGSLKETWEWMRRQTTSPGR